MSNLPELSPKSLDEVKNFAEEAFSRNKVNYFVSVEKKESNLFRVFFDPTYFVIQPDRTEPSKSQWNTLKKHIKRLNSSVFVSKFHGLQNNRYFVDIGFFVN